jgi:hypothetical protein
MGDADGLTVIICHGILETDAHYLDNFGMSFRFVGFNGLDVLAIKTYLDIKLVLSRVKVPDGSCSLVQAR